MHVQQLTNWLDNVTFQRLVVCYFVRFSFPHPLVCSHDVPQFCVTSKMDDDLLSSFNNSGKYQMTIEDHKPAKQTSFSQFTFCSFYSSIPLQEPVSTPWSAYSARIVTSSKTEIGSPGKIDISFVSGGYRLPMPAFDQKYCSLKTIGSNFFFLLFAKSWTWPPGKIGISSLSGDYP